METDRPAVTVRYDHLVVTIRHTYLDQAIVFTQCNSVHTVLTRTGIGLQQGLFIHGDGPDTCLDRLLAIAKRQGAPDNVTAVLMQKQ